MTTPADPPAEGHGHGHRHGDHDHGDHGRHDHGYDHRRGIGGLVSSIVRPHSHDASDAVDPVLSASADGMRTLKLSLAGLAATALVQVVVVAVSGSVALLADTIHNFADALTAVPLAAAFWLSRRPPTRRYTYGFGRSEDLAGIFIVVTIAASSAVAGWEAINRLMHPHSVHRLGWVAAAGVVGFVGNEAVARYRIRTGRRIGSAALEADGHHARTDGFTSLAVVAGAAGVALGWRLADPVVGLAITVAILLVVKNAARDIYRRLMDAVDPTLVERVSSALGDVDGIEQVEAVRIRWIGHELHAEAEVVSNGGLSLAEAHEVGERAHHHLLHEVPRLAHVTIHTSPSTVHGTDPHALTAHHRRPAPIHYH
jgi:cation diffusion facilitator family transporter